MFLNTIDHFGVRSRLGTFLLTKANYVHNIYRIPLLQAAAAIQQNLRFFFPGSKWIAGNILCIGFFFDSGRCFYSMYRFFYRFRKMLLEAEIIDSVFYVCHRDYTYILGRWGFQRPRRSSLEELS